MRLIRKQIYRAFPELDTFSDPQCVRFVTVANSSWASILLRWACVGVMACGSIGVAAVAAAFSLHWVDPSDTKEWPFVVAGVVFVGSAIIGLTCALVVRDWLLRQRVRGVIARCGSCSGCGYSLLGMRVGADLHVTCPECGLRREVDPAMGELATDEMGTQVYRPEVASIDGAEAARKRARRWRMFKWTVRVVVAAAILLGVVYSGWWGFLYMQARAAESGRSFAADMRAIRAARETAGASVSAEQASREWMQYLEIIREASELSRTLADAPKNKQADGVVGVFDTSVLLPQMTASAFEQYAGKGSFALSRQLVRDTLAEAREVGIFERIKSIRGLRNALRPVVMEDAFAGPAMPGIGEANITVRLNMARFIVAMQEKNQVEYFAAMDDLLAMAALIDHQGLLIDRSIASMIRQQIVARVQGDVSQYPDESWSMGVLARLRASWSRPSLAETLEGERAFGLDGIRRIFQSPSLVHDAYLGEWPSEFAAAGYSPIKPNELGTYWGNVKAYDEIFESLIQRAKQEPWARSGSVTRPTGYAIVDMTQVWMGSIFAADEKSEREYRRTLVIAGAELFCRRSGRAAESVDELKELLPDPRSVVDPMTNKRFLLEPRAAGVAEDPTSATYGKRVNVVAPSDGASEPTKK